MIVSRKFALVFGLPRYFTGVPCPRGHVAERYASSRNCADCVDDYMKTAPVKAYRKTPVVRARKAAYSKTENGKANQSASFSRAYARPEGRASYLWNGARQRAAQKKEPFYLTHERVTQGVLRGVCERTGLPFSLATPAGLQRNLRAPSVDKIDPRLPYSDDNVQIVLWHYNIAKWQGSDDDLAALCAAILNARKGA